MNIREVYRVIMDSGVVPSGMKLAGAVAKDGGYCIAFSYRYDDGSPIPGEHVVLFVGPGSSEPREIVNLSKEFFDALHCPPVDVSGLA